MKIGFFCLVLLFLADPSLGRIHHTHPRHEARVWTTKFRKTIFRVVKLPNCNHLETIITYRLPGETKECAKKRLGGVAVCTACFYNPTNLRPVDFFRRNGKITVGREIGRPFLKINENGPIEISRDYSTLYQDPSCDALALGPQLVPYYHDGFSMDFASQKTDRMALAMTRNYLYIVQGKTNLKTLEKFINKKLRSNSAINTDGGHSVKGYSPFHLVFRWKKLPPRLR